LASPSLSQELMASGFVGLFDFFYLPIDLSSGESRQTARQRTARRARAAHNQRNSPPTPPALAPCVQA